MTMPAAVHEIAARLRKEKARLTPHVVPQPGLLRLPMGDDAFLAVLDERRRWIEEHCREAFALDDLRDGEGVPVGKLYRFTDGYEAVSFRMRF